MREPRCLQLPVYTRSQAFDIRAYGLDIRVDSLNIRVREPRCLQLPPDTRSQVMNPCSRSIHAQYTRADRPIYAQTVRLIYDIRADSLARRSECGSRAAYNCRQTSYICPDNQTDIRYTRKHSGDTRADSQMQYTRAYSQAPYIRADSLDTRADSLSGGASAGAALPPSAIYIRANSQAQANIRADSQIYVQAVRLKYDIRADSLDIRRLGAARGGECGSRAASSCRQTRTHSQALGIQGYLAHRRQPPPWTLQ